MRYAGLIVTAALLMGADAPPMASPGWMAGAWIEEKGDRWSEEYWSGPRAGMQMGASRSGMGATIQSWEFARIAPDADGTLAYFAQPQGRAPVVFRLVVQGERSVTFENMANDYPTRIRYWWEGEMLNAEISGRGGANVMRWTFKPMGGG